MTASSQRRPAVLGIDFGATNVKVVVVDAGGRDRGRFIEPSRVEQGPDATSEVLVAVARRAVAAARRAGLEISGVGVGACGPVDHAAGRILESPVLPGWKDFPVAAILRRGLNLPVALDNDANAAVLGEWWQGAGERRSVVAGLTLGTGIGGGLVVEGRVFRGATGVGTEFGHIRVAPEPACPCGGRGCLGRVASATATLQRYRDLVAPRAPGVADLRELGRLAASGDSAARQAIDASAAYLAQAVLVLVNVLNPEVFVLTGGMALLGETLLAPIRHEVRTGTFRALGGAVRVEAGRLGLFSGCFGAACLALHGPRGLPDILRLKIHPPAEVEPGPFEPSAPG